MHSMHVMLLLHLLDGGGWSRRLGAGTGAGWTAGCERMRGDGSRAHTTSLDADACGASMARTSAILHRVAAGLLCSGYGSTMAALARS